MPKKKSNGGTITTDQLAERWGLTRDHLEVRRMRGQGPPFIKLGDDPRSPVRYLLADIVKYEDENKHMSTNPGNHKKP